MNDDLESIFVKIYETNTWGSNETKCGTGSELSFTQSIRWVIINLIRENNINFMLDTSCGDWNWMKTIHQQLCNYTGIDIVKQHIDKNTDQFSDEKTKFIHGDFLKIIKTLQSKSIDLVLCRHTLEHLPEKYNLEFLTEAKRVSKYLLVTTHDLCEKNTELPNSIYRPINLSKSPYKELINQYYVKKFYDGSLNNFTYETFIHLYKFDDNIISPPIE